MKKQFKIYSGNVNVEYQETDEKKQMLWDAFIKWCKDYNASSGESSQNDDFQIDAPDFMAEAIDKIIKFKTKELT